MQPTSGRRAVYAGSFDPVTLGHLDVIQRARLLFDHVTVAVGRNIRKDYLFTPEERIELLNACLQRFDNVSVASFSGLLVDFAREDGACAIVRGLRAMTDFDYEFQIGLANMHLNPTVETIFLLTSPRNIFISSSLIKELGRFRADLSPYLPKETLALVEKKFKPVRTATETLS